MKYKTLPWIAGNMLRLQSPLQKVTITAESIYMVSAAWNGIGWVIEQLTLKIPT